MSSSVAAQLDAIAQGAGGSRDRPTQYRQLLETILAPAERPTAEADIKSFLSHAVQESLGVVQSRQLLQDFTTMFLEWAKKKDAKIVKSIWLFALDRMNSRAVAFEEQISVARENLATIYEDEENWLQAAKVLQEIPLDSGHRLVSDAYKLKIYIRIVRLLLEEEDGVAAGAYLNRAALLLPSETQPTSTTAPSDERVMHLQFKACQARALDLRRAFLPAASKYLELSYMIDMHDSERISALIQAVTCTVLAGAGPQRTRMLATLYKDERVRERPEVKACGVFAILEKMYLGRVLRDDEVREFASTLKTHQVAMLADNMTVLDRAVMEHNVLSASHVYNNIGFAELGRLLAISEEQAEHVVTKMMGEGRLTGSIDRLDRIIYFSESETLPKWDAHVASVCHQLDSIVDTIKETHPGWSGEDVPMR